jgi:hypothetical protein
MMNVRYENLEEYDIDRCLIKANSKRLKNHKTFPLFGVFGDNAYFEY